MESPLRDFGKQRAKAARNSEHLAIRDFASQAAERASQLCEQFLLHARECDAQCRLYVNPTSCQLPCLLSLLNPYMRQSRAIDETKALKPGDERSSSWPAGTRTNSEPRCCRKEQ